MSTDNPRLSLALPRREVIDRFSIVLNTHYSVATKVNLYFDDDPRPVALTTSPTDERQDFDIDQRPATKLTIELADFDKPGVTTGIDNLWIRVVRSEEWHRKVKPLLSIGGLVKYPMGKGGLILNQINAKDSEPVPDNLQKKRAIVAALLRNLHAVFSGGKALTTANLSFEPIPLEQQCNQYLTADRGWYDGERDLSQLPHGEVVLGGVHYLIRDFKTSPLPSCVMLAGAGVRGQLPHEVTGLRVGTKADALYFLHAFNMIEEWRPRGPEDEPPVVFQYVVHFADGESVTVPVRYGWEVGHWISRQPAGLRGAAVAWAAPFARDESGDQAVLYQLQWTNPRPEAEIAAVDLVYGPDGSRYGAPALLAITAARQVR